MNPIISRYCLITGSGILFILSACSSRSAPAVAEIDRQAIVRDAVATIESEAIAADMPSDQKSDTTKEKESYQ